ncbi:MAG: fimbrillin family protein [Dysgonamonadaceae bacterium]|nr:fimbrillin family protein [Dysgonamonadaceae bacterium]
MFHYICYLIPSIIVLCGLVLLVSACEKEVDGKDLPSDKNVAVQFALGDTSYDGHETLTRSTSDGEPETVVVPLEDTLYMYASLEEDRVSSTRAATALADGVKVRIVAYEGSSSTIAAQAEYTVTSNKLSANGSGISVQEGEYIFVAYSYNSSSSPDNSASITVSPDKDLLWGSKKETIGASTQLVTIPMKHKFSLLTIKATTDGATGKPAINSLSASVTPGYSGVLDVKSGTLKKGASATQNFTTWTGTGTSTVTSVSRTVYTSKETPVKVKIGSITIGNKTIKDIPVDFNKQMESGRSYTLTLNLKKSNGIWAGSNVYWDAVNKRMTFDAPGSPISSQMKQGVLFQWTSMVGVSPTQPTKFESNVTLYEPNITTGRWTQKTRGSMTWDKFGQSFKSDICAFLTNKEGIPKGDWRMPEPSDFGKKEEWSAIPGSRWQEITSTNLEGTIVLSSGVIFQGTYFPASGYRGATFGTLMNIGAIGKYWTKTYSKALHFDKKDIIPDSSPAFDMAFPIRCIK